MRILVVEEDQMLAEFLQSRLAEEGFSVHIALASDSAERSRAVQGLSRRLLAQDR